jgi:hypothetical protein
MKKIYYLWLLLALPISGCLKEDVKEVRVDVPINEFENACTVGKLGGVPISCEKLMAGNNKEAPTGFLYLPGTTSSSNPRVECADQKCHLLVPGATMDTPSTEPALIIAIEPGTYEANLKVPDNPMTKIYDSLTQTQDPLIAKATKQLIPHLRTVIANLFKASVEQTILEYAKGKAGQNQFRYGRIYFVMADTSTKNLLLQTIDKATHLHNKVDLFIIGHGVPGIWSFTPDFDIGPEHQLTAMEVIEFGSHLGESRRNRIRSIFSTHCFSAEKLELQGPQKNQFLSMLDGVNNPLISSQLEKLGMPGGMDNPLVKSQLDKLSMLSMNNALALAFPSSRSYGSIGINYFPLHRDWVAFDRYYQDDSPDEVTRFSAAVAWGAKALEMNLADNKSRSHTEFPKIKIKAEGEPARGPGWLRKRFRRNVEFEAVIPSVLASEGHKKISYPFIFEGAKISGQNVKVKPVEVENSKFLSSYFPRNKWPTVVKPPTLTAPAGQTTSASGQTTSASGLTLDTALANFGGFGAVAVALPTTAPIYQNLVAYQDQEETLRLTEFNKNKPPEIPKENLSSYAPVNNCIYQGVTIPDGTSQSLQLPMGPEKIEMLLECKGGAISLREPAASSSVTPQVPSSEK